MLVSTSDVHISQRSGLANEYIKEGDYQQRKLGLSKSVSYADSLLSFPRWKKKYPTIAMQNALRKTGLQRAIVGYFFIYLFIRKT